jgi:dimethylargininase
LTHLERTPIDYARAVEQHEAYEAALRGIGCDVRRLPDAHDSPDSVFVEDTAVVFDDLAVIARPGAASRRGEVPSMTEALRPFRRLAFIQSPGTLDGGDVLVTPGRVFVGISGRTNADGARQLATHIAPLGFETISVPVTGCLHLKSAVTALPVRGTDLRADRLRQGYGESTEGLRAKVEGRSCLAINPNWVDPAMFRDYELIEIDSSEPMAANVLAIGDRVVCAEEHPNTRRRLEAHGLVTLTIPAGELARAEGGVTCCSVLVTIP